MKQIARLMIVAMLFGVFFSADIKVNAVEDEDVLLESSDDIVIVDDIDEYIEKLNAGIIAPVNSKIETYEPKMKRDAIVGDPSKSCSNIFGHKWGEWTSWEICDKIETKNITWVVIERWRFCERTHCGARQREWDTLADYK